jgi:multiple sugar transport system substrate-binding protein
MRAGKRLSRRDFMRLSAITATGALAAACGPATPETPQTGPTARPSATSPAPTSPPEAVEMEFWNGIGPPDGNVMQDFMNRFEDSRPDVRITQWTTDWEGFYTKIQTSFAEGLAPDLAVTHPKYLATYADTVFQPIDDLVEADPEIDPSMFAETPWRACFYNGKQYALPIDTHCFALYCNVDLLEQAGVALPRTEEELIEAARALSAPPDRWGLSSGYFGLWDWMGYMAHRGQRGLLTEDGTRAAFNNEAGIGALQREYDNIYLDRISWSPEEGLDPLQAFMSQACAMRIGGTWEKLAWDTMPGLNYTSIMFMPDQPGTWGNSHLFVFPRMGTNEETQIAWEAAKAILRDSSVEWGVRAGHMPALVEAAQSEEYLAVRGMQGFRDSVPHVIYEPQVPRHAEISAIMWGNLGAALYGAMGVEEALADAEAKVNEILAT